jgi:hypothetical protein
MILIPAVRPDNSSSIFHVFSQLRELRYRWNMRSLTRERSIVRAMEQGMAFGSI